MSSSQIQTLSNQFNSLLTDYQTTYAEFMNTINSNDTSLTTVENSAFTGSGTINTNQVSTINDCSTACSSNTSCSGATFTSTNNNCTLSSGSGNIVNSGRIKDITAAAALGDGAGPPVPAAKHQHRGRGGEFVSRTGAGAEQRRRGLISGQAARPQPRGMRRAIAAPADERHSLASGMISPP